MKTAALMLVCVIAVSSAGFAQDTAPSPPVDPVTQVRQAMESARTFARAGKVDESLTAIRDVLKDGPPVKVTLRGFSETLTGQASSNAAQVMAVNVEVAAGLSDLDLLWREKQFPPAKVFETLWAIVFPESRKTEVFTYSLLNSSSAAERNAGSLLVDWAVDAAQSAKLRELLEGRSPQRPNSAHYLMRMQLAWAERDSLQMSNELVLMATTLEESSGAETATAMLPAVSIALRDEDAAFDASSVIESIVERLAPAGLATFHTLEPLLSDAARL